MDFWQPVGGLGPYAQLRRAAVRGLALIGEPVTFSVRPADAEACSARPASNCSTSPKAAG